MEIQDIVDFCEGRLAAAVFEKKLMAPEAEAVFEDSPPIPPYTQSHGRGMVYYYLIEQNYKDVTSLLNAQDCLTRFLKKKGISVEQSQDVERLHTLLLNAQPAWLNAPTDYASGLLGELSGTRKEQQGQLKKLLLERFRYMKKPPKWLQDAVWPIIDGKPLVFVGQMDISPLSHDQAQLYVFF